MNIKVLEEIDRGTKYVSDENSKPFHFDKFSGSYTRDSNITLENISEAVSLGMARETIWGKYTIVCLTYQGKLALLKSKGWSFDTWVNRKYACCEKAIPRFCVCIAKTDCIHHGIICNGSH